MSRAVRLLKPKRILKPRRIIMAGNMALPLEEDYDLFEKLEKRVEKLEREVKELKRRRRK